MRVLGAQTLARRIEGYPTSKVPRLVLGKGNYFGFAGRPVFSRLIYPTPIDGGLGVHVTLDLAGRMRFGPDVEWIAEESYTVDPRRAEAFYDRIRALEYVRRDQDFVPMLRDYAAQEDSQRLALTRTALAPFRVERALIPIVAAMLDVGVYKALKRIGMDLGQAATDPRIHDRSPAVGGVVVVEVKSPDSLHVVEVQPLLEVLRAVLEAEAGRDHRVETR